MFGHFIEVVLFMCALHSLHSLCGVNGSLSGFYMDNGKDQTIMHRSISQDDAQEMEHEILELLGLPERPRRKHAIHPSLR